MGSRKSLVFSGFEWVDPSASGLLSIAWRSQWEASQNAYWRDKLVAYNADDCEALSLVARTIERILVPDGFAEKSCEGNPEIVHAEELGEKPGLKMAGFQEPAAGLGAYQRSRVLELPTGSRFRTDRSGSKANSQTAPADESVSTESRKNGCVQSPVLLPGVRQAGTDKESASDANRRRFGFRSGQRKTATSSVRVSDLPMSKLRSRVRLPQMVFAWTRNGAGTSLPTSSITSWVCAFPNSPCSTV